MSRYPRVVEYLQEKIKKTQVNSKFANTGCKILKGYCEKIPNIPFLVNESMLIIEEIIHRSSSNSPRGEAPLTYTSSSIGTFIDNTLHLNLKWHDHVRLGDLFVEGFYNDNQIDINYEKTRDSCHTITLINGADHPVYTIKGSSDIKPKPITKMIQSWQWLNEEARTRAIIKGKTLQDNHIIRDHKDSAWLKSIDKIQQQSWMIDKRILGAVFKTRNSFAKYEDKQLQQREDSKRRERRATIIKGCKLARRDFYQYISADYRGRLYFEEPFLNFQGSDYARGMMKFGEGKPMTEEGLKWLAIHTANSYNQSWEKDKIPTYFQEDYKSYLEEQELESISLDKMTLNDRIIWCNNNNDLIFGTADRVEISDIAEKPVSFLACCLEWNDYDTDDNHQSYLPIPIDGSNNGWQHLGAISKDIQTGELVGLVPVDIQRDFYVQTAKELYKLTTDERRKTILDIMPMKDIRKGISKRGSMTRAYSAGAKKIAENMWLDCRTEGFDKKYKITEEDCLGFANDLILAIETVCPGPLKTMKYLQDLAQYEIGIKARYKDGEYAEKEWQSIRKKLNNIWDKYNAKAQVHPARSKARKDWQENNKDWYDEIKAEEYELRAELNTYETKTEIGNGKDLLSWTTPSKFPVDYEAFQVRPIETFGTIAGYTKHHKKGRIHHKGVESTENPDINKFVCGVSPNYIHSLDASHMSLIISDWSGYFGPVHDSFSTHACDVGDLLRKTKSHFIKMYDCENYFDRIRYQLTCNTDNVKKPDLGDLNIKEVNDSDYFFA